MPQQTIIITRKEITALSTSSAEELAKLLGGGVKRRLSHIEPTPPLRRWFFRFLRRRFGDEGRVSDWTRRWRGPWQIDFAPSGGAKFTRDDEERPFLTRDAAVAFEERKASHYLRNGKHC